MAAPLIDYTEPSWSARRRVLWKGSRALNYANWLQKLVELYGKRTAFMLDHTLDYPGFHGDVMSFDDVGRFVGRMAGALRALGVGQGDRVGLITMNRIEMAFCNFAAAQIGAIPVPMNFMLRPNEIEYIVQKAGIELLVTDANVFAGTIKDTSNVPSVKRWAMIGDNAPAGTTLIADLMRDAPDHVTPVEPRDDDDTALLFFTSGTTGFPKGATLSHNAAMIGMRNHVRLGSLSARLPRRVALLVMPVAHAAGYATMLLNLGLGTPAYFLSKFDPQAIFEQVERLKPTIFAGTPAMYRILLGAGARDHDWSSIKVFGGGADAFDDDLIGAVRALGTRHGPLSVRRKPWFIRGYGMAEANSYVAQSPPFEAGDNCIGWVLPPVTYKLVDEDGNEPAAGKPGELLIKGPNVTRGYWNDPEATKAAIDDDGWFHTGDIVRRGKWKMLFFVGRSGDIIKSGGYKIAASEIDQHLTQHPDVEHAATVGIPHPIKGERPFSAVKLHHGASVTEDELLEWARERIAPYKCPRAIVIMNDMPFTFSLKPKHREVRDRLIATLPQELQRSE